VKSHAPQRGFTLVELVVAIAIGSVVVVFVAMFLAAPLGAFEAQSRRNAMVGDAMAAWPRMQQDLAQALPNSVRVYSSGTYVAIEMLTVAGVSRLGIGANINSTSITAAGSPAGLFTNQLANPPANITPDRYLSVNPDANVYTLSGSITSTPRAVRWTTDANGAGSITVTPAPAFTATPSARQRLYLVGDAVTYLCDLRAAQRTLRRYSGYAIAASQASRATPNGFASAATNELISRGITACSFAHSGFSAVQSQTVSVRLTATRSNESVTMMHQVRAEYVP
jgi:MSHA biogenesis protein MshO